MMDIMKTARERLMEREDIENAKEKTEVKEPEKPVSNPEEGSKPEVYKPIDDANLAAKRMEDATKAAKEENDRAEEIAAKSALGGRAEGGQAPVEKKETDEEYVARFEKGEVNPIQDDAK